MFYIVCKLNNQLQIDCIFVATDALSTNNKTLLRAATAFVCYVQCYGKNLEARANCNNFIEATTICCFIDRSTRRTKIRIRPFTWYACPLVIYVYCASVPESGTETHSQRLGFVEFCTSSFNLHSQTQNISTFDLKSQTSKLNTKNMLVERN